MEINIKFMSEEAYITLKKHTKEVYQNITDHPSDSSWLKNYLGFEPYEEKKYVIEDFELKNSDNYDDVALDNAITLYESLKHLPRYILCDKRFWAWILFEKAYKIAPKITSFDKGVLDTRWLIDDSRRSLMLGVISRQYFKVEVSIQEKLEDKYELTRLVIRNHTPYKNIAMRNIGMLKNVTISYLKICELAFNNGITLNDYFCSGLMKEASKIGSVMLIDIMSEDEIYNILLNKFHDYCNENNITYYDKFYHGPIIDLLTDESELDKDDEQNDSFNKNEETLEDFEEDYFN